MRLCIVTPSQESLTETFIRSHLERLPHKIIHLYGYQLDYHLGTESLRSIHARRYPRKWLQALNLLPRYAEFRIRNRFFRELSDQQIVTAFLQDQQIDVVLAEYGMTGAFLHPACASAQIPLVVHFHGADASRRSYVVPFGNEYRKMFRSASATIAVSQRMQSDLIKMGCPKEKIYLCVYGPNPEFFGCSPNYDSDQVVAVGRLTAKKAPHLTILAFQRVLAWAPELRLMMIGDGELLGVCRDLVAALGLGGSVTLANAQSPEAIRRQIDQSFLFVQHSVEAEDGDSEGTPVAVLEAGAAGLPVVATRHAGIPDVVIEGVTGMLVDERDSSAMADSILRLAADRTLCRQIGKAAREHIARRFSIERHLSKIDELLHWAKANSA